MERGNNGVNESSNSRFIGRKDIPGVRENVLFDDGDQKALEESVNLLNV